MKPKNFYGGMGYQTDGSYILFKSGFTSHWKVETDKGIESFRTKEEAEAFVESLPVKTINVDTALEIIIANLPLTDKEAKTITEKLKGVLL